MVLKKRITKKLLDRRKKAAVSSKKKAARRSRGKVVHEFVWRKAGHDARSDHETSRPVEVGADDRGVDVSVEGDARDLRQEAPVQVMADAPHDEEDVVISLSVSSSRRDAGDASSPPTPTLEPDHDHVPGEPEREDDSSGDDVSPEVYTDSRTRVSSISMRFFKFIIGFIALLSLGALGGSVYFLFYYNQGSGDVLVDLIVPDVISQGVPFALELVIENASDKILQGAELSITIPDSLVLLGIERPPGTLHTESLGDVGGGSVQKKLYTLLPIPGLDGAEEVRREEIRARLSYALGQNTGFEVRERVEFVVGEAPFSLSLDDGGEGILSGAGFRFSVGYINGSSFDFSDVRLEIGYPNEFSYASASLSPDSLNNYWKLGALPSGSEGSLTVRGVLEGVGDAQFAVPVTLYGTFSGVDYPLYVKEFSLGIAPSPLHVSFVVNGSETYVSRLGDVLTYTIRYTNNSGVVLSDLTVKATLRGEMFDFLTLRASSTPSGIQGSIFWDKDDVPALARLEPGASGEIPIMVALKDKFPIFRLGDTNFSLRADVSVESPSVPYYLSGNRTRGVAERVTKVAGNVSLDAKALFRDSASGIVNGGTLPPKVGVPTQYSVHWVVRNFATDVRDVSVRAALPTGVEWVGLVGGVPEGSALTYDESSRFVVWELGNISATKGVLTTPLEVIFQIVGVPASSHVGLFQPLLDVTRLTGDDVFTGISLSASHAALTTSLTDDPTVGVAGGIVVE